MSDGKKILVHAGANKTGSSAIQRFLAVNSKSLASEGIVVPDAKLKVSERPEGHHVWVMQNLMMRDDGRPTLENAIAEIDRAAPEARSILLSAENLAANPNAPKLFAGLARTRRIEVIIYIRRQDEYLLSSWQQWNSKISSDFWAWMIANVGILGDWRSYIQAWETAVPKQNISVRPYERKRLIGQNVVEDFYSCLRLKTDFSVLQPVEELINPSFSESVMDLVKGNKAIFKDVHDNLFYDAVRKFTGSKYIKNTRESSITFDQRMAIIDKYRESNEWIKKNYLGRW